MYKIIRNIDKLGRIVLPKNIREMLDINIGDDLELEINEGKIVLTLQDKGEKIANYCDLICESIYEKSGHTAIITHGDMVLKVAGITKALENKTLVYQDGYIVCGDKSIKYNKLLFSEIISRGKTFGKVYLLIKENQEDIICLQSMLDFMSRYIGKLVDG